MDETEFPEEKSRSEIKREAQQLYDVGEKLIKLNDEQLHRLPLDSELLFAVQEFRRIKVFNAQKRQLRRIAKLLRNTEHEEVVAAIAEMDEKQHRVTRMSHVIENWRDRLIDEDKKAIEEFLVQHPDCDRQQLNQLVRNAKKEKALNKAPASARKLFKFIRDGLNQE